ncbi:hypothetical protein [Paraburkholderia phosphatilytica]|uniref:hypothetical protein n=1 Tax=Paraburkholderia phosphatilytica TaxID=2282883 RepID=UPI000E5527A2|nr:hypothetical protein [Paraburkholderia phosphatilytica]
MEHLVRVVNEKDRQTLEWLRRQVGDAAIAAAVSQCEGPDKPWLSAVCRRLGVVPPAFPDVLPHTPTDVARQSLAAIRAILAIRVSSTLAR